MNDFIFRLVRRAATNTTMAPPPAPAPTDPPSADAAPAATVPDTPGDLGAPPAGQNDSLVNDASTLVHRAKDFGKSLKTAAVEGGLLGIGLRQIIIVSAYTVAIPVWIFMFDDVKYISSLQPAVNTLQAVCLLFTRCFKTYNF